MTLLPTSIESRAQEDTPSLAPPARQEPSGKRENVGSDVNRLSVGDDGRLYWDDKPVVIRRRLLLSGWQKFGAIVVSLAALIIAASGAIHAAITAHEWLCGGKWISSYCPAPAPSPAAAPPRPELPN